MTINNLQVSVEFGLPLDSPFASIVKIQPSGRDGIVRLKPAVSTDEALEWLKSEAVSTWGLEMSPEIEQQLQPTAQAMALLSALDIPEDVEPLLL